MSVRAKVYIAEISRKSHNKGQAEVVMRCAANEQNKEWAAATPYGEIKLGVMNESAAAQFIAGFDAGQEFYVDFTPVPPGE